MIKVKDNNLIKAKANGSPKLALLKSSAGGSGQKDQRPRKLTPYGEQLSEKQKAKRLYGLREKQFRNYFIKALKKTGNTGEWLFSYLENRLDNTVYRLNFADSRPQARQWVNHGHFLVNGQKVNIPSYQIKVGDVISIREKSLKAPVFQDLSQKLKNKEFMVSWLVMDTDKLEGKVTGSPKLNDVEMHIDWRVIIEFYSK